MCGRFGYFNPMTISGVFPNTKVRTISKVFAENLKLFTGLVITHSVRINSYFCPCANKIKTPGLRN